MLHFLCEFVNEYDSDFDFRVPCRRGTCATPMEVASCQLMATRVFPEFVIKALLYPGAIAKAIITHTTIPTFDRIFKLYNLASVKRPSSATDLHRLEVLAGSYLCVAGAFLSLIKPGRISLFGTLLTLWGLAREILLKKVGETIFHKTSTVDIYPMMLVSVSCAFLSVRRYVRRIVGSSKAKLD
ncbi:uncharacterized protein LOC110821094 isoform X2 [Carica papaya]|uniref:uncharacterized protein LOC110821094 isoform X2 n=1 Tax=Carica papaya TaxID=3649 RepID=UPI000B8D0F99|nr:uncharacterized protein LOC110821094 isoform X2 [Carica papaya]